MRRDNHHVRSRVRLLAASALATALLLACPAAAQPSVPVSIPAGSLESGLHALAAQTGQQLMYSADLVAGRTSAALYGEYTPEDALQRLLKGSGIVATRAGPKAIVLKAAERALPASTSPAPAEDRNQGRPFDDEARPPIAAAPQAEPAAASVATTVDELEVTGTLIRGAGQGPSPLIVLGRDDLDRSGHATVAAALAVLPQNFAGTATEASFATGTDRAGTNGSYGSGVNLRGLGSDATLVLVNGRRMAGSGAKGDFADLSTIPTAAVDRVEILLDGASALYGSDAVGGVINIVLRRRFEGFETRASAGVATAGEPFEGQFAQTVGHQWATGSALISYEFYRRDALPGDARAATANADLRPLGGTDHRQIFSHPGNIMRRDPATATNVVGWAIPEGQDGVGLRPGDLMAGAVNLENQRAGADTLPRQVRHSLYAAINQELGDRLEVSGDLRYGHRAFDVRLPAATTLLTVTSANPFFVSPTGAASHQISYSFVDDLPSPRGRGSAESLGLSAGGDLRLFGDWKADLYGAFAQEIGTSRLTGGLNASSLQEALGVVADQPGTTFSTARDGFFNPFTGRAANTPAVLAFIGSGFTSARNRDRVYSLNLKADGTLLALPGGDLKLAVGGQVRREAFDRQGVNFVSGVAPTPAESVDVSRTVSAAFVELRAPIVGEANRRAGVERLEVSLAGRIERYSDFGTTANPKVGVLWSPAAGVMVRGSYGTSFRAPALRELHDAPFNSPSLLPLGSARVLSLIKSGGNPDLDPETATSWTAGFDVTPQALPGFRLSATLFKTHFDKKIDQPVRQSLVTALADPTVAQFITRISPTTNAQDLALISALLSDPATSTAQGSFPAESYGAIVDARFVNTASLRVRGLDVTTSYTFARGADRFSFDANGSWLFGYEQKITPTALPIDLVGVANFPAKFRGRASADWSRAWAAATLAVNYSPAYRDPLGVRIGALTTFDVQLRATPPEGSWLSGTKLTVAVRNLFDKGPPFYDSASGIAFDPANADPIGRFVSVQIARSW